MSFGKKKFKLFPLHMKGVASVTWVTLLSLVWQRCCHSEKVPFEWLVLLETEFFFSCIPVQLAKRKKMHHLYFL